MLQTLGDISTRGAKLYKDRECIVFEGKRFTYKELDNRVNSLANYLLSLKFNGVKHIAILADNCSQYVELYFASAKAGCVTLPLNARLANKELSMIIQDAEAKIIFFGDGYADIAKELAKETGIKTLISIEKPEKDCLYYEELIKKTSAKDPDLSIDENQMAILMYTGGTTGRPKGVMLSHRNLISSMFDLTLTWRFQPDEITCFILPIFHASVWPIFCVLSLGGKVAILRKVDLDNVLQTIQSEKCTHINAVPTIYNWLMENPNLGKYDLSTLRNIGYAGSPIVPVLLKKMLQKFGPILAQGYGLTEAAPGVCALLPEDHVLEGPPEKVRRLNSIGREMYMPTVKVVREDGTSINPGEIGEIIAKGKNIMLGYWKMPEKTAETLIDGWLHTGDLGTVDEEGYIFLMDRKNDMIITGGENVYPKEVEGILSEHPAVMEVAVVGIPDQRWGESVKAVIVLKTGMKATAEDIIKFAKSHLAGYKCPKTVDFRDSLIKTATGKISRSEIKKEYWKGHERLIS